MSRPIVTSVTPPGAKTGSRDRNEPGSWFAQVTSGKLFPQHLCALHRRHGILARECSAIESTEWKWLASLPLANRRSQECASSATA